MAVSPQPQQNQRQCVSCGRAISWDSNVCPYCGHDYRQPAPGAMMPTAYSKPKTSLPVAGGVLVLITGILGMIMAVSMIAFSGMIGSFGDLTGLIGGILIVFGVVGLIFSILVILGGYFAIGRTHFVFAIIAAVLSLLVGLFTPFFIGCLLGLIGLILIAVAHNEFN